MNLNLNISKFYATFISIGISLISIAIIFYIRNKNSDRTKDELVPMKYYLRGFFYKGRNYAHLFIISIILKLISNENITVEKSQYTTKSKKIHSNFIFKKINSMGLDEFEKYLFEILFSFGDEISTRSLNKARLDEPDYYNNLFTNFLDNLDESCVDLNLKINKSMNSASLSFFMAMINLFSFLILVYNHMYIGILNLIFSIIFFILAFKMVNTFTKKGIYNFNFLKNLEENYKNLDTNFKDEDFLTALSFNISGDILKKLNKNSTFDFYFEYDDFYKTLKTALVGDHFLIK